MADVDITDQLDDELAALVLDEMLSTVYHQVALSSPLISQLETSEHKEERNGGARIRVPLRTGKNTSFRTFGKGAIMTPQPYPTAMFCYYNFKQGAGDVLIDWVEEREHAAGGGSKVADILKLRVMDLMDSVREDMNRMFWTSAVGNDGRDLNGIQLLIPTDPRTGILGGLDRAGHIWWRNSYWDNNVSTYAYGAPPIDVTLGAPANAGAFGVILGGGAGGRGYSGTLKLMETILNNCSEGESLRDYFILTERQVYEQFIAMPQHMGGITINYSNDESIVKWNFGGALFRGVPILYDSVNMGAPTGEMRFINKKYVKLITDSGAWFTWTSERSPYNQFAKARYLMLRGQLVMLNPRKNGIIQGITAWA